MSVVLLDVLRHQSVEEHPCLAHPEKKYCGLGPSHPANIGKMLYNFSDPELNIKGSSTQTLTGGICLDKSCNRLTTVTLHDGSCSYTADMKEGDKTDAEPRDTLFNLTQLVSTLMSVEEVNIATLNESVNADVIHYGLVHRDNERDWEAEGYRGVSGKMGVLCLVVVCYDLFVALQRETDAPRALGYGMEVCLFFLLSWSCSCCWPPIALVPSDCATSEYHLGM